VFLAVTVLLFVVSTVLTIIWCGSMPDMAWMRMPGQSWPGAAATFLGMWVVMMVAMKLPSLVTVLWRHRQSSGRTALGYFFVWTLIGVVIFPVGVVLSSLDLSRVVPVVIVVAGALQWTRWKARELACYRHAGAGSFRQGMRLGLHCCRSCAGLMAILLCIGVMDLRAMAVVAAAITAERLAGEQVARAIGAIAVGAGLFLIARAS